MSLPKIEYPIYEIYLKSLDRKVKFRPFLVKEEKILLMAKEAKDDESVKLAINQVINNCAVDPIDVNSLPLFDIEMIFVKLRAKSVGETVKLVFTCKNEVEGKVCDTENDYVLNLENVKYVVPENHDSKIMITDKLGIKLKYPTLDQKLDFIGDEDDYTATLAVLLSNIEYIFDGESIHRPEDTSKEDVREFVENLTIETMEKIGEFFRTSPKVVLSDTVKCKKCGFEHTLITEDLLSFFL